MSVKLAQSLHVYAVEFKDKDYTVHIDTNVNIGYTNEEVMLEGEPVEDEEAGKVLEYFHEFRNE